MIPVPSRRFAFEPPEEPERRSFLKRLFGFLVGGAALASARNAGASPQSVDPYIGEIAIVAFNFPPRGWEFCNGQLLSISGNEALFSLLGTTYGGDGRTTFALPDLRGRAALHAGQGPGLSNRILGSKSGTETHALSTAEMPAHNHAALADPANGTSDAPNGRLPAKNPAGIPDYGAGTGAQLAGSAIGNTGGNQAHNNMQPFLALNYVIALVGVYPPRNLASEGGASDAR